MERENNYSDTKFLEKSAQRVALWESLIKESGLDETYVQRLDEIIGKVKNINFENDRTKDDWVYFTLHQITNEAIKKGADQATTQALFENLREDIWKFWKEIKDSF